MARSGSKSTRFAVSPEKLLAVVTDPAFQAEQRELDDAVTKATAEVTVRDAQRCVIEIRATEYDRGVTGLDKNKTISSVTKVDWNLEAMTATWTYESTSAHAARFTIKGGNKIKADGDGAILEGDNYVEVRLPLVGGQVEKLVLDGLIKGRDGYDQLLRDYLAR